MQSLKVTSAITVLALGITLSLPADAATQSRIVRAHGGTACQLSIPTTDTKVRPKALGFRNEGTSSAFAICGVPTPNGTTSEFGLYFLTIDGINHAVNCTAVYGIPSGPPIYSSKSVDTGTNTGAEKLLVWDPSDFGIPSMDFAYVSVTCNLPGQASVSRLYLYYNEDVGN